MLLDASTPTAPRNTGCELVSIARNHKNLFNLINDESIGALTMFDNKRLIGEALNMTLNGLVMGQSPQQKQYYFERASFYVFFQ